MPTGYTAAVADGEVTEFADFAMRCARAFGACITMRGERSDTPIPDEFKPSEYHSNAIREAEIELRRLEGLSEEDKALAAAANFAERLKSWQAHEDGKTQRKLRYEAMLAKVKEWVPPTAEHIEMKSFMTSQLQDSIRFDCGTTSCSTEPTPLSVADWFASALSKAHRDLAFHAKEQAEEIERARKRTKWVADLRASLVLTADAAE